MTPDIIKQRRRTITRIRKLVAPYLWESGYVKVLDKKRGVLGPTRPFRLWVPTKNGEARQSLTRRNSAAGLDQNWCVRDWLITFEFGHTVTRSGHLGFPIAKSYRASERRVC